MLRKKTGKAKTKISFHELSEEELAKVLREAKNELRELRFKSVTAAVPNPKRIGALKKDVARVLTVQRLRAIKGNG
ncbi:MAG: 50S ribosomal protein L29 [Leptospiraceae bacterium]|nr:50S ribosomal protein L29 [Leptospiraceae bacterium]MCB1202043.1 50S ribosomal protein L29 [Leptospiraceae bacterium]